MPSLKTHCEVSRIRTAFDFEELHKWIDEPLEKYGTDHRLERHSYNTDDEKFIIDWFNKKGNGWGDKAVVEWLFHIALDNLHTAFKKSYDVYDYDTLNHIAFGLSKSMFVYIHHDRCSDEELGKLFARLASHRNSQEDNILSKVFKSIFK
jgi:hypothetical protein